MVDMRYLGIRYHPQNFNTKERELRIRAMRSGWTQMGKFWASQAPDKVKRIVFICHVMNAGYSGMEAMIPARVDHDTIDRTALALLRSLMQGAATWNTDTHKKSMTNDQVWKRWRLVPSSIELTVRRLLFFINVLIYSQDNVQVISALFGDPYFQKNLDVMKGEPAFHPTLTASGLIDWETANPWACMYIRDMEKLAEAQEGTFQQIWERGNVHQLLQEGPVRDSLKLLDPTILRSRYLLFKSVPPQPDIVCQDIQEPPSECYRCTIGLPDGRPCNQGKPFDSKKAYIAHLQKGHKISEKQYHNTFVLTNVCPMCDTVLKTRVTAINHFQRSIELGRCKGSSRDVHPIVAPPSLTCHQCQYHAADLQQLHAHFRAQHFDFVDAGHLAQFSNPPNNP